MRDGGITRRAAAGLVVGALALGAGGAALASDQFTDVPDSNPFHDDVAWMASVGITNGYADGGYHPGDPVTRQAMSAFMRRLAGQDPAVDPMVDADTVDGAHAEDLDTLVYHGTNDGAVVLRGGATGAGGGAIVIPVPEPTEVLRIEVPAGRYQVTTSFTAFADSTDVLSCTISGGDRPEYFRSTVDDYTRISDTHVTTMKSGGVIALACTAGEAGGGSEATTLGVANVEIDALRLSRTFDTGTVPTTTIPS